MWIVRTAVLAVTASSVLLIGPRPAAACSCVEGSVAADVRSATAVYVARPRFVDLFPGTSFRVTTVLKGPERANLRVKTMAGGGALCGTTIADTEYVLPVHREYGLPTLSLCNNHLEGPDAVEEAVRILGSGRAVATRADPAWVAQWALIVAIPAVGGVIWSRRRERAAAG